MEEPMSAPKKLNIDGVTINSRIAQSLTKNADKPALSSKIAKSWKAITYGDLDQQVRDFSMGLRSLGVERGDRVALISENRPEWAIADVAILAAGAVTVPIYSTLPAAQVAHILADSGTKIVIASDSRQLAKIESAKAKCPSLTTIISMEKQGADGDVLSFQSVYESGSKFQNAESFEDRRDSVRPADVASLVYTSGTTGDPKGAMLTHRNFAAAVAMAEEWFPVQSTDTFLSFLPLCHVFERVTHYLSLSIGTHTYYAESIFKVQENLTEVRPTIMQSVPRLFETIHDRVMDGIAKAPDKRKKMALWALSVGTRASLRQNSGKLIDPVLGIQRAIADKLVLSKIRERLGGNLKFFVSGGAPLSAETAHFFNAINIPILEGYGMTETTAPLTCNKFHRAKVGTVGQIFPEVSLSIAPDGEILAKGPNVMAGYWNSPGATQEMFNEDGWLTTGDIGKIDSEGYVYITDRKKDIIVLANGKNVAPQPIESLLKHSPFISEIVLVGDKAGTVTALVVPATDRLTVWAKENKIEFGDLKELSSLPEARKKIKSEIDSLSGDLAEFEKVRKIAVLHQPLTIENGELTPTLKVKRKVVFERYGKLLD
jgi:long-chain acyl-CoA synthetase